MSPKRSIKQYTRTAQAEERRSAKSHMTADSFQNFLAKSGIGTDNISSASTYGINPITRQRVLLEWIHRGSWLGGVAVDLVADDMTRAGVEFIGKLKPDQAEQLDTTATQFDIWGKINEGIKWGRLYGGAIVVPLIADQDYSKPWRVSATGKDQFKGLIAFDRWMLQPSLSDVVTELGPDLGEPKFYTVLSGAPGLPGQKIHHSRCIRIEGIKLPWWQRMTENMWGLSVLERLYDRMLAFDSATQGAAQLVYKSYLRTYKIDKLRELIAGGGKQMQALLQFVDMMRRMQNNEGITLIDGKDDLSTATYTGFGGLADALMQFGEQLSGALQIPLVRLFGQSPSGLNSSGESDLRTYYDGINQQQNKILLVPVTRIYRSIALSQGIHVPDNFGIRFRPLWQLTDKEKAEIASSVGGTVEQAFQGGVIGVRTAMEELRQSSRTTNIFTNITDEDIEEAEAAEQAPSPDELGAPGDDAAGGGASEGEASGAPSKNKKGVAATKGSSEFAKAAGGKNFEGVKARDARRRARDNAVKSIAALQQAHDLHVVIENPKGSVRSGAGWSVVMPYDYGYILTGREGADGDPIDCCIGPNPDSPACFIVDQRNYRTGKFDEHKVLLGYTTGDQAMDAYVQGYNKLGRERIGAFTECSVQDLKNWMRSSADLKLPYSSEFTEGEPLGN